MTENYIRLSYPVVCGIERRFVVMTENYTRLSYPVVCGIEGLFYRGVKR